METASTYYTLNGGGEIIAVKCVSETKTPGVFYFKTATGAVITRDMNEVSTQAFWYEWGNEPVGKVSTGFFNNDGVWKEGRIMNKEIAEKIGLTFCNPHS